MNGQESPLVCEQEVRAAHRHLRLAGGYVACACGEDWTDHRAHVEEKVAAALVSLPVSTEGGAR